MFKRRFAVEFVLNGVEASPSAVTIHRISQEVLYHLHLEKVSFCLFFLNYILVRTGVCMPGP